MTGLSELGDFEVDHNDLDGPIPDLTGLINLVLFDVRANRLDGPLPAALPGLISLQFLHVEDNRLSGTVPQPPAELHVATLCPNRFDIAPNADPAVDAAWDAATRTTPWWRDCDAVFAAGFE